MTGINIPTAQQQQHLLTPFRRRGRRWNRGRLHCLELLFLLGLGQGHHVQGEGEDRLLHGS